MTKFRCVLFCTIVSGIALTSAVPQAEAFRGRFFFRRNLVPLVQEVPAAQPAKIAQKKVADKTAVAQAGLADEEAVSLATEAYIYGYPLITMEFTRRVMTNASEPKDNHAPMGQFYLSRTGRTYCTGTPQDYKAVHALQDHYALVPLSAYGKPFTPPKGKIDPSVDMKTAVRDQVNRLDVVAYFKLLAMLMKDNPPAKEDGPMLEKMAKLNLFPGKDYTPSRTEARTLQGVPKAAFGKIMGHFKHAGRLENGWSFATKTGLYGSDYLQRALITAIGLGANRPQDAVYPTSEADVDGKPYSGANKYVIHFAKGQTPPVKGFWSITMYNADYFFVANPLNRYTVSSRFDFKYNKDGSLDLYIQNKPPGKDKEANWLPTPEGKFILMLRMYWPQQTPPSIIDGSWKIPGVKKVS